jgi:N,N'-diacetyllegionaminate synthase
MDFLSSPFDIDSARLLNQIGLKLFKIPSGEITNLPYLEYVGATRKPILLSTGMSTLSEIEGAIEVLCTAGSLKSDITVLHCTSAYPAPIDQVNLRSIRFLADRLRVNVGYSDHTSGVEASVIAVAFGATVIEKHFTLCRELPGPDHNASLEPTEFSNFVQAIRRAEVAIGIDDKLVAICEEENKNVVRKSIVAKKEISAGQIITSEMLAAKRPASGLSPMRWREVVGTRALRNYKPDEILPADQIDAD